MWHTCRENKTSDRRDNHVSDEENITTSISFFKKASRVKLLSLRVIHKSRCGVPNSTVKVTNILKEFKKVTILVTYFYIRTKLAIVVVVES